MAKYIYLSSVLALLWLQCLTLCYLAEASTFCYLLGLCVFMAGIIGCAIWTDKED